MIFFTFQILSVERQFLSVHFLGITFDVYKKKDWHFSQHPLESAKKMGRTCISLDENGKGECPWSTKCPQTLFLEGSTLQWNGLVFSSCSILNIVQHDIFTSMHKMNLGTNRWYLQGKEHLTVSANNVQLVFRRIAQLPFALQLSKAYVRLEGRSLLWLIMMSLRTSVAALGS